MATSNFRKQNNFPLYATTFFDGFYYTAEEWKEARKNEKDSYGRYYDYKQPYSVQKRLEQQEKRKILEFINEGLKPKYDFEEYKIIGQFSNGETFYKKVA